MKDYKFFFPDQQSEETLVASLKKYQERRKKDFEDIDREIKEIETALKKPDPKSEKKLLIRLKEFKEYRIKVQNEVPKEVATALEKPDPKYVYEHYEIFCKDEFMLGHAASSDCVPIFKLRLEKLKDAEFFQLGKPVPVEYYIYRAASENSANLIRYLNPYSKDINYRTDPDNKCTALYWAVQGGQKEAVKALLEHPDIDLDAADAYAVTPLARALYGNYPKIGEILLKAGAKLSEHIIMEIFDRGNPAFLDMVIERVIDYNFIDPKKGITLLHAAVADENEHKVRQLIELGARADIISRKKYVQRHRVFPSKINAFEYATIVGSENIIALLKK